MKKIIIILVSFLLALPASASLYNYYKEQGQVLPNVLDRVAIAADCGIENYVGSYEQNIALEDCLRSGANRDELPLEFGAALLSSDLTQIVADFKTSLSAKLSIGGTSLTLQSVIDDDGNTLASGRYSLTIDGNSSNKEYAICDLNPASSTCSNIINVSRQGVRTSGAVREHRVGATVTITDFTAIKMHNDLLSGLTAFDNPIFYTAYATPTDDMQIPSTRYVNNLAIAADTLWLPSGANIYNAGGQRVGIAGGLTSLFANSRAGIYDLISVTTSTNYALYSQVRTGSTVSTTDSYNIYAENKIYGSTTNSYGIYSGAYQQILGTTENRYGVYIANPTSNGTTTNNYGLYIPAQTAGTNNYAIYSLGPNYLNGTTTLAGNNVITGTTTINGSRQVQGFFNIQVVSTTGTSTWSKPSGVTKVKVRIVGGGGNGTSEPSESVNSGTNGGGAGGYAEKIIDISASSSVMITVGAAGATSSFGNLLSANPGYNINPGVGVGGDINSYGDSGGVGSIVSNYAHGGHGGASALGGGGKDVHGNVGSGHINGNNGYIYGGGGSGCVSANVGGGNCVGGSGAQGVVIIEY